MEQKKLPSVETEFKEALQHLPKKALDNLEQRLEIENNKPPMIRVSLWEYSNLHKRIRELEATNKKLKQRSKRK